MVSPTREVYWHIQAGWLMYVLLIPTMAVFAHGIYRRYRLWRNLGKPINRLDRPLERLRHVAVHVGAHLRLFRDRPAGWMHFLIFWSMALLFMGTIVVAIDADLHIPIMRGRFYLVFQSLILDLAGAFLAAGLMIALIRRYLLRVPRVQPNRAGAGRDLSDGLSLLFLLLLMVQGFALEGFRMAGNPQPWDNWSPVGYALSRLFGGLSPTSLVASYQVVWWSHMVITFAWIAWLPYSKMLHIFTGAAAVYTGNIEPTGRSILSPIDFEQSERLGASTLTDFTWKDLLDLDACTACGRCQAVCPAYASGQPLSPRNLILDLRDYMTQHGPALINGTTTADELPPLVGGVIKEESLWACTTCRACMEECPVGIEHVPKIVAMRRHLAMEQAAFPAAAQDAMKSLEDRAHPYRGANASRTDWCEGLEVPQAAEVQGEIDLLYWVGCTAAFDPRNQKVARAFVQLLQRAGVSFAILGDDEACCGDPARRMGNEFLYDMMARQNIDTLNRYKPKRIVTACPHCLNAVGQEYRELGGEFQVVHHTQLLRELIEEGRLNPGTRLGTNVTFHDPCYLGRWGGEYDAPRAVLTGGAGAVLIEMERSRSESMCCGAGGAHAWMEEQGEGPRINQLRARDAVATGAAILAVGCPFCLQMMEDGVKTVAGDCGPRVKETAELLLEAVEETAPKIGGKSENA